VRGASRAPRVHGRCRRYVQALRIEGARLLLETGTGAIDDIGYEVGYEDPTFFRRLFRRKTSLTPAAYRRKFAPIVAGR
jgi:transcriptional regulator GlxA family with amidase domain